MSILKVVSLAVQGQKKYSGFSCLFIHHFFQEVETYGIDYCTPDLVFNDDQESLVVPELVQIPDSIIGEVNAKLQQPVDSPYEVQQYLDICHLIQAYNELQ